MGRILEEAGGPSGKEAHGYKKRGREEREYSGMESRRRGKYFGTRSLLGFIYKGAACTAIGVCVPHNISINNITLYTNTNRRGDNNPLGTRGERARCRSERSSTDPRLFGSSRSVRLERELGRPTSTSVPLERFIEGSWILAVETHRAQRAHLALPPRRSMESKHK